MCICPKLVKREAINHPMRMEKKATSKARTKRAESVPTIESDAADVFAPLACTNTALRRASRRLSQLYDEALAPLDMKATQMALLSQIDRYCKEHASEGPSLQELASRLGIQVSAVTHAMRPLVRDELVELRADAEDKRSKRCVLTALGRKQLKAALAYWVAANRRVDRVLGAGAAATLRTLADKVASDDFFEAYQADSAR